MWFFAILVVLVMGGVAALAAGRGAPMAEAYDDRPDALVPADRPLDAEDLRRVRFPLAFRGYRMTEVDALLDRLAGQLERDVEHEETAVDEPPGGLDAPGQDEVADDPAGPEPRGEGPLP